MSKLRLIKERKNNESVESDLRGVVDADLVSASHKAELVITKTDFSIEQKTLIDQFGISVVDKDDDHFVLSSESGVKESSVLLFLLGLSIFSKDNSKTFCIYGKNTLKDVLANKMLEHVNQSNEFNEWKQHKEKHLFVSESIVLHLHDAGILVETDGNLLKSEVASSIANQVFKSQHASVRKAI